MTNTTDPKTDPVAVVDRYFAAVAGNDMATMADLIGQDVTWHQPGANRFSGVYQGQGAVFGLIGAIVFVGHRFPGEVARRMAEGRVAASHARIVHVGLGGQSLPLDDQSCDGALATFTLCTIPDPEAALAELRRVLRPGGRFHFLEHGLAPDLGVAAWQRRIEPMQRRLADGCHLTRDPVALVSAAGFTVERHESRYAKGPKPWTWMTEGFAVAPA